MIICPECKTDIDDVHDTTYSNINTDRCNEGDHTGDIYRCDGCDSLWIDDFLTGTISGWRY